MQTSLTYLHLALFVGTTAAYDYSEILKLNASCSPKDTCSVPRDLDHYDHHNCDCSSFCALYDTCCIDSPFLGVIPSRHATCRASGPSNEHAFMVDSCPNGYSGPIHRRCERQAKDWSDPFERIPVTNPNTQTTYKSLFCGLCNGEDPKDLRMWQIALDCTGLKGDMKLCQEDREFVLQNMIYLSEKSQWGVWSHDDESDWMFGRIGLDLRIPDDIAEFVRGCRPNLVSKCHPDYVGKERVRSLCGAYTGAVYFREAAYKNIHCAVCNFEEDMSVMSCHGAETSDFKGAAMNFGTLLDFYLRDGKRVGQMEGGKCESGWVYDPFAKRCRKIECPIPGFTLKDGKCAPN